MDERKSVQCMNSEHTACISVVEIVPLVISMVS
jgi:hypothetical protein